MNKVKIEDIRKWAKKEGNPNKFEEFERRLSENQRRAAREEK